MLYCLLTKLWFFFNRKYKGVAIFFCCRLNIVLHFGWICHWFFSLEVYNVVYLISCLKRLYFIATKRVHLINLFVIPSFYTRLTSFLFVAIFFTSCVYSFSPLLKSTFAATAKLCEHISLSFFIIFFFGYLVWKSVKHLRNKQLEVKDEAI